MNRTLLVSSAGVLLLCAAVFYGWRSAFRPRPASPQQLAEVALTASVPEERQQAAAYLPQHGSAAVEQMVRVFSQSQDPVVRAEMIRGLSQEQDLDHMPQFLDALDDPVLLVRVRAAGAVQRVLQIDVRFAGYRAEDPPEQRAAAVAFLRNEWKILRNTPGMHEFKESLAQKRQRQQEP